MKRRDFIKTTSTGVAGGLLIPTTVNANHLITDRPITAKYIWFSDKVNDRNTFGVFRKSFTLSKKPQTAELNLFADTVYQLFINGEFVDFGPVRFDPRFPQYDRYDLAPWLREGRNSIVVLVNHFGQKTYKSIRAHAGFIAWGRVVTDKKNTIDLTTHAKNWKTAADPSRKKYASKISFALNNREIIEQVTEDYLQPDFNDVHWNSPVEIPDSAWGKPEERTIPFMSKEEIPFDNLKHLLPLKVNEDIFSFSVPVPWYFEESENPKYHHQLFFSSWIYSPRNQNVVVGTFWGEYWLNGTPVAKGNNNPVKSLRVEEIYSLKEGWNFLSGYVGLYYDNINLYFGFPKEAGVKLFAEKDFNSPYSFRHSGLITKSEYNSAPEEFKTPILPENEMAAAGGWKYIKHHDAANDPCMDCCWDDFGNGFELPEIKELPGFLIRKELYPEGASLLFELDYTRLAFPIIDVEGVKEAIIDLEYSEMISADGQHLKHEFNYTSADRIYCHQNSIKWVPMQPRGMKYLRLTIRNTGADVKLNTIKLRSASYPVANTGYLKCSDPLLTEIWTMGQRTQATNMEDAYVDCVTRERGMYGRDTIIQYHVNLATFGDHKLMHRCLELYGQSPDPSGKFRAVYPNSGDYTIADFALNMSEGFKSYYDHTGDTSLIKNFWPELVKNIGWFNNLADENPHLLLDAEWHKKKGVNAHYGGFHGDLAAKPDYAAETGLHCTFTATYLVSLRSMLALAQVLQAPEAADYQNRINILEKSINNAFWDDKLGAFADNTEKRTHSAHANLLAVRAGVPTESQKERIKQYLSSDLSTNFKNGYNPKDGSKFSPNFAFYIFDGLYQLELDDLAQSLMKEGWGWALAQGYRTTPEYFEYRPHNSHCHAWSASPTYYLSKSLLGITFPQSPNTDIVKIKIQPGSVTWAEGAYPHPKGKIEVRWHKAGDNIVFDYTKAPEGVVIEIE